LFPSKRARRHKTETGTQHTTSRIARKSSPSKPASSQLESALDFEHQGDRDGRILFPPLCAPCSRHKHDEEIAFDFELSTIVSSPREESEESAEAAPKRRLVHVRVKGTSEHSRTS
jgi:hypothetical protein